MDGDKTGCVVDKQPVSDKAGKLKSWLGSHGLAQSTSDKQQNLGRAITNLDKALNFDVNRLHWDDTCYHGSEKMKAAAVGDENINQIAIDHALEAL